eukprot:1203700-Prymnesium_polylepis.1
MTCCRPRLKGGGGGGGARVLDRSERLHALQLHAEWTSIKLWVELRVHLKLGERLLTRVGTCVDEVETTCGRCGWVTSVIKR